MLIPPLVLEEKTQLVLYKTYFSIQIGDPIRPQTNYSQQEYFQSWKKFEKKNEICDIVCSGKMFLKIPR